MRRVPFLALALVLLLLHPARGENDVEYQALRGSWRAAAAELAGAPFPDEIRTSIRMTLQDDTYTVVVGETSDRGTVKLDPTASPKTMDITGTEGPNQGNTLLAIYELEADTLRVCYDLSGKARPTKFETTDGTLLFLVTYEREKQD